MEAARYSLPGGQVYTMWSVTTMECYAAWKREGILTPASRGDEPWRRYVKQDKRVTKSKRCTVKWGSLHDISRVIKFVEMKSRAAVARLRREGKCGVIVKKLQSFSFARWRGSVNGVWRWSHGRVHVLSTAELGWALRNGDDTTFYLCGFLMRVKTQKSKNRKNRKEGKTLCLTGK